MAQWRSCAKTQGHTHTERRPTESQVSPSRLKPRAESAHACANTEVTHTTRTRPRRMMNVPSHKTHRVLNIAVKPESRHRPVHSQRSPYPPELSARACVRAETVKLKAMSFNFPPSNVSASVQGSALPANETTAHSHLWAW